jgi:hypothetical protein
MDLHKASSPKQKQKQKREGIPAHTIQTKIDKKGKGNEPPNSPPGNSRIYVLSAPPPTPTFFK